MSEQPKQIINLSALKELIKDFEKFCEDEHVNGYQMRLEAFTAILSLFKKKEIPEDKDIVASRVKVTKNEIIFAVTGWKSELSESQNEDTKNKIRRRFDNYKTVINNILQAMAFSGLNQYFLELYKDDADNVYFATFEYDAAKAEQCFKSLVRNKGTQRKRTSPKKKTVTKEKGDDPLVIGGFYKLDNFLEATRQYPNLADFQGNRYYKNEERHTEIFNDLHSVVMRYSPIT